MESFNFGAEKAEWIQCAFVEHVEEPVGNVDYFSFIDCVIPELDGI